MPHNTVISLLATLTAVPLFAIAGNLSFLGDAPLAKMSSKDLEQLAASIQSVLNTGPDGETVPWGQEEPNSGGALTPLKTYSAYGTKCRELKIRNNAGGTSGKSRFHFCFNKKENTWKILK